MGKTRTSFKPGQSGNPNGRPPKSRTWTALIEKAGSKTIDVKGQDTKTSRKRFLAESVMEAVTLGRIQFADGTTLEIESFNEWRDFVKWVYTHIDGPPKQQLEHSGELKQIVKGYVSFSPDDWDDEE